MRMEIQRLAAWECFTELVTISWQQRSRACARSGSVRTSPGASTCTSGRGIAEARAPRAWARSTLPCRARESTTDSTSSSTRRVSARAVSSGAGGTSCSWASASRLRLSAARLWPMASCSSPAMRSLSLTRARLREQLAGGEQLRVRAGQVRGRTHLAGQGSHGQPGQDLESEIGRGQQQGRPRRPVVLDGPGEGDGLHRDPDEPRALRHPPGHLHGHEDEQRALVAAALHRRHDDHRARLGQQGGRPHGRRMRPSARGGGGEKSAEEQEAAHPDREGLEPACPLESGGDAHHDPHEEPSQTQCARSVRAALHGCVKVPPREVRGNTSKVVDVR